MTKSRIEAIGKANIDMLVALQLILSERSVSKAAVACGLSQPAMSSCLARMRTAFDDTLLVKVHGKMELTSRGQEVLEHLELILPQLERLMQPSEFDPGRAQLNFQIAATDYAAQVLGPALVTEFSKQAPGSSLVMLTMQSREIDAESGEEQFDLRLGWFVSPPPSWFIRKLFEDRMVVIAAAANTSIGEELSVEQFTSAQQIGIRTRQHQTGMDKMLQEQGVRRNVIVWMSNFSCIPQIVARSNLLALVPESLAQRYHAQGGIRILAPPVRLNSYNLSMAWSPRVHHHPANRWLRSLVVDVARGADHNPHNVDL
jgi:DNA-binding transcriptional LysR family regulator